MDILNILSTDLLELANKNATKMKTLIVYETVHGSAEKCALMLKDRINHNVDVVRLKEVEDPGLSGYDIVVIGGSIHNGVIHTRVRNFIEKNIDTLVKKSHALFLVCIETGQTAIDEFNSSYPEDLRKTSIVNGIFGGELLFGKMNSFEKFVTKKVVKVDKSVSRINYEEIYNFAKKISSFNTFSNIRQKEAHST